MLDDRLIIVKPGLQAGAGFGAKVTSFPYHQIQGINLRTAMLSTGTKSSALPIRGASPSHLATAGRSARPYTNSPTASR